MKPAFKKPQCAVLMAVYNGMQFLPEQIVSVLNQTDVDVTLIISVDVSTDGSYIWLVNYAKVEQRIKVLPYGERFGGAALNFFHLIANVDCSYFDAVAFADQDDIWHVDKLKNACQILAEGKYVGYSSNVIAFWEDGRQKLINKAQPQKKWDYLFEAAGPGCTYVMRPELITQIKAKLNGNWQTIQYVNLHDWFCYAFARANNQLWFIDSNPSMLYRQHASNQVGVNSGISARVNRFKKITNGWWLTQSLLIAQLVKVDSCDFVKSWASLGRIDLLRLSFNAFQCRRKLQEQLFFFAITVFLSIKGLPRAKDRTDA